MLTKRGVQVGTFVVEPDAAHVEGIINFSLDLIAMMNQVGPDDFLDAWHAIEAPAAQLAAKRCHPDEDHHVRQSRLDGHPRQLWRADGAGARQADIPVKARSRIFRRADRIERHG